MTPAIFEIDPGLVPAIAALKHGYVVEPDSGFERPVAFDAPKVLYVRANDLAAAKNLLSRDDLVAITGARAATPYGSTVARLVAREVVAHGGVVVTGLARGVDTDALRAAVDLGAPTVAVLGCGIDRDYPIANALLAREIVEAGGVVVSEYPAGVEPAPWRFPARNRIIAALSRATVVVEARERSGSLITVDFAMEFGRPVYAVPGEITSSLSAGTNKLLTQGARPLVDVEVALDEILPKVTVLA